MVGDRRRRDVHGHVLSDPAAGGPARRPLRSPALRLFDTLGGRPWLDPELTAMNRQPMRPLAVPCPDRVTARALDATDPATFAASPWWRSLDGTWRFRLHDRPEDVPLDAIDPATDDRDWDRLDVPGAWTMQAT